MQNSNKDNNTGCLAIFVAISGIVIIILLIQIEVEKNKLNNFNRGYELLGGTRGFGWVNYTHKEKLQFLSKCSAAYDAFKINPNKWCAILDSCFGVQDSLILNLSISDMISKYYSDNERALFIKNNGNYIQPENTTIEVSNSISGTDNGYKWNKCPHNVKINLCVDIARKIGRNDAEFYYDCIEETYNTDNAAILREQISFIAGMCTAINNK